MKKRIWRLIILFLLGGLIWWIFSNDYDSSKPTEFYEIEKDIFVMRNAPYDTADIRKVIEKFNLETWPIDTIQKYEGGGRLFYRETKYMTRNFKEDNEYDPVYSSCNNIMDYRNHKNDILMTTAYHINSSGKHYYYYYWLYWDYWDNIEAKYDNEVRVLFRNLDSLLSAKKKEYGLSE